MSNTKVQEDQLQMYRQAYMPLLTETEAIHKSFMGMDDKDSMLATQPTRIDSLLRSITQGIVGALLIGGIGIPLSIFVFPIPILLTISIGLTTSLLLGAILHTIQIVYTKYRLHKLSAAYNSSLQQTHTDEENLRKLKEKKTEQENSLNEFKRKIEGDKNENLGEVKPSENNEEFQREYQACLMQNEKQINTLERRIAATQKRMEEGANRRIAIIGQKFSLLYREPAELFAAVRLIEKRNNEIAVQQSVINDCKKAIGIALDKVKMDGELTDANKELLDKNKDLALEVATLSVDLENVRQQCETIQKQNINLTKRLKQLMSINDNIDSENVPSPTETIPTTDTPGEQPPNDGTSGIPAVETPQNAEPTPEVTAA